MTLKEPEELLRAVTGQESPQGQAQNENAQIAHYCRPPSLRTSARCGPPWPVGLARCLRRYQAEDSQANGKSRSTPQLWRERVQATRTRKGARPQSPGSESGDHDGLLQETRNVPSAGSCPQLEHGRQWPRLDQSRALER